MSATLTNSAPSRPSVQEMAAFLDRLRRLVLDEAMAQQQELSQVWARPIPVRVSQGRAIEGVRIVKVEPNGLIELECDRNVSRFREGDILRLNQGVPYFQPSLQVTLEMDDDTRLIVSPNELGFNWGESFRDDGWVLDEDALDLSAFYLDALKQAGDTAIGRERILPLLMGRIESGMDTARFERALSMAEEAGLNWSQSEALAQAYATDLACLIQGPPGTGKTRVLAHIAQALVDDGERVLVTALTHRAINNALNKIAEVAPDTPAIKVGSHTRADGLQVDNYENFDASPLADTKSGYIVGATPFAARGSPLSGVEFETALFDEASQVTLPLAVMGMLAGKKYVFIGDQKQLPPVRTTRHADAILSESVFGWLAGRERSVMLNVTYRLSAELAEWPSRTFYNGALIPAESAASRRLSYAKAPERLDDVLNPERSKVFVDLRHRNTTTRSQIEASLTTDLVVTLIESGVPAHEIGVITPYRAQSREIRKLLLSAVPDRDIRRAIVVDTVDRMQGQERDVIIVSLATSSPAFAASIAEFFFQPERLNVSVTRPRKKLIIVGSRHVLDAELHDTDLQADVALLRDLLDTCAIYMPDYVS